MLHVTETIPSKRSIAEPTVGKVGATAPDELVEQIIGEIEPVIVRQFHAGVWHDRTVSKTNMFVLMLLGQHGPMPMNRLAGLLDVSFPSLSGIVDRMEENGLVERIRDDSDRRIVLVQSTAKGGACIAELQEVRRDVLRRVLRAMDVADQRTCLAAFSAMRRAAEKLDMEERATTPCGPERHRTAT